MLLERKMNMTLIKGIHHISMQCSEEEYAKVIKFYVDVLGLSVRRRWNDGVMLDTGCGIIEIFVRVEGSKEKGVIRHFALATDDVDGCAEAVKKAGYPIFIEPKNTVIPSNPPYSIRMAFCIGPLGEEIEFFQGK